MHGYNRKLVDIEVIKNEYFKVKKVFLDIKKIQGKG